MKVSGVAAARRPVHCHISPDAVAVHQGLAEGEGEIHVLVQPKPKGQGHAPLAIDGSIGSLLTALNGVPQGLPIRSPARSRRRQQEPAGHHTPPPREVV